MLLREIQIILNAEHVTNEEHLNIEIKTACGSDLMSDVLAFGSNKGALLTGLINPQVIRTAEMMDICAIIFVRGKTPSNDVVELARQKNIVIMKTNKPLYEACGLLYANGLKSRGSVTEA